MLPLSSASASCERFESSARASASGLRLPGAAELDHRRLPHGASGEQCAEVGVGRNHDSIVRRSSFEDLDVFCVLQPD